MVPTLTRNIASTRTQNETIQPQYSLNTWTAKLGTYEAKFGDRSTSKAE
jgi:hypothetical protein